MTEQQKTKILKRELAELLGCLPIVVSRLVKKGEVKVGIDGKIDISSQEMKEYIKNKRIEIQRHKERIRKKDYTPNGELKIKNEAQSRCDASSLAITNLLVGEVPDERSEYEKLKINNILKNNDSIQELQNQNNNPNEQIKQVEETEEYADKQDEKPSDQDKSFANIEYETKQHKLQSEKYKSELLEMEVRQRKKDLVSTEILNRIITKTIGNLTKNIVEIPINIVDEIIDIVKSEEEPKSLIINLITKNLHKEIESTIDKTEKEFLNL